ncbi:MAG TPA: heavy-metal-associated domain-containing protein [Novimethylophilus sp.]|uniref:heavy-metal-associated domain-containing protein n=1 Tax=Novimethylophilus sp. TaxID=2137426 RepID=UPI002F419BB6
METVDFLISGMACGGCANTVKKALLALDGVMQADVSHAGGRAEVVYDPAKVQPAAMKTAIEAAGYTIK